MWVAAPFAANGSKADVLPVASTQYIDEIFGIGDCSEKEQGWPVGCTNGDPEAWIPGPVARSGIWASRPRVRSIVILWARSGILEGVCVCVCAGGFVSQCSSMFEDGAGVAPWISVQGGRYPSEKIFNITSQVQKMGMVTHIQFPDVPVVQPRALRTPPVAQVPTQAWFHARPTCCCFPSRKDTSSPTEPCLPGGRAAVHNAHAVMCVGGVMNNGNVNRWSGSCISPGSRV